MTFVAVTLAIYLGFSGAIKNTGALLYQSAERMIDSIVKDIGHQLDLIYHHAARFLTRVLSGEFDPQNAAEWEQVVSELPVTLPQVTRVAFIGVDLQGWRFNAGSAAAIRRDFSMLTQATKRLQKIRESRKPQWLHPLWSPNTNRQLDGGVGIGCQLAATIRCYNSRQDRGRASLRGVFGTVRDGFSNDRRHETDISCLHWNSYGQLLAGNAIRRGWGTQGGMA